MKTKILSIALVLFTLAFSSCSNDDDNATSTPTPTPTPNGFQWTENGGTTIKTAASATFTTGFKTLIASDASGNTVFEINLDGTVPATYTVGSGNAITYAGVTPFFTVDSGNIVVTANASNKISGTFQGTGVASSGITSVTGTFTNITVVP